MSVKDGTLMLVVYGGRIVPTSNRNSRNGESKSLTSIRHFHFGFAVLNLDSSFLGP